MTRIRRYRPGGDVKEGLWTMPNRLIEIQGQGVPNLVVAQRVINKMSTAASRYIEDETGEAMVGLIVSGANTNGIPTLYVLDTIAPDESAVRHIHTFQQGDDHQDELIWWLQENWRVYRELRQHAGSDMLSEKWDVPLRYLGDWHKQPGYMIQPSQGDLRTAEDWIADDDNGMDFLLAPIVTLGHPATTLGQMTSANFVTVPADDGTCMRVDFWYLDTSGRGFLPISPTIYPDAQLPKLTAYPWHLVNQERFNTEVDAFERDGLFTSMILWNATDQPPLEVCFMLGRVGSDKVLILVTPWNFPEAAPSARIAPFISMSPDDDLYQIFETMWEKSEPVKDPADWTWMPERRLLDYIFALEDALGLRPAGDVPDTDDNDETGTVESEAPDTQDD
ncbi:MAG: hypothetical protein H6672_01590 [Anaerolineaceae bacterium]|nr:hypothetical protein [Anaerolineaceae bacterium]